MAAAGKPTKKKEEAKPSRLELRREARKQAILRAAGAELARAGYNRASLDDIAEHVHVTKATLYHYFANKEELYRTWMDDVSVEVNARLAAAVGDGPARQRLWQLANAEVLILTTDFPDYARLFMSGVDWPEPFQQRIRELRRAHEASFRAVIDDGVAAGEFDAADETIARYCLQGALAYVPEWYRDKGRLGSEELAASVADAVIRMFASS
jgi:AcrR family transcriptional regulator